VQEEVILVRIDEAIEDWRGRSQGSG